MSQRTEPSDPGTRTEPSNSTLVALSVASLTVLVLVFWVPSFVENPLTAFRIEGAGPLPWLYPWILAGSQTLANGLTEFSGRALEPVDGPMRTMALLSILLVGVITPTLALQLMGVRSGMRSGVVARGVYLVSVIITATFVVSVVPIGSMAYRAGLTMRESQAIQANKDGIINDLNVIAWKLREYRILPKALDGGEGSAEGFVVPASEANSEEATYNVAFLGPDAKQGPVTLIARLRAVSKKYPDCEVVASLGDDGSLSHWDYAGRFR